MMGIRIGTKVYQGAEGVYLIFCPGCKCPHWIPTHGKYENPPGKVQNWTFDGNGDAPTFNPSLNITGQCHSIISGGNIKFCADSTHALSGQTVPLPDYPREDED